MLKNKLKENVSVRWVSDLYIPKKIVNKEIPELEMSGQERRDKFKESNYNSQIINRNSRFGKKKFIGKDGWLECTATIVNQKQTMST